MGTTQNQSGFAHILIVVVGLVMVGAVGFFAWQAFTKSGADVAMDAASKQAREECEKENDKDICRFVTNWKTDSKYRMTSTGADGSKFVIEVDGDKTYMKTTGEYNMETISHGKTTYTKAGNTWYKQTLKDTDTNVAEDSKVDFKEPAKDEQEESKDKTYYKLLGKEACGNLSCFKYEVVDPENKDSQSFIWFDDKDYKLRRTLDQDKDGSKTEATFEYDNVSIKIPSPVKELAADQFIMPGATEPQSISGIQESMMQ